MARRLPAAWRLVTRALTVLLLAASASYIVLLVLGYQPLVMTTGSMRKTIPVGALVIDQVVDPASLHVGDVITFEKPLGEIHGLDTHRIVAIRHDHGKTLYRTKGDSNPVADPWRISFKPGTKAHRMAFSLPYLGWALLFSRSADGRIAIIALVCLMILHSLFKAIAASSLGSAEGDKEPSAGQDGG